VTTILVIEDDPSIRTGLRMNLGRAGYTVQEAGDGDAALAALCSAKPDLVLLDVMLPGINGLEILRRIRQGDPAMPVVILSALGNEADKVVGLDLGANDYLTKPFSVAELLARTRAALRARGVAASPPPSTLRAGGLELEPERRVVRLSGVELDLAEREFEVLRYFMERPERVLTREQLLAGAWQEDYEGTDRTVDNVVSSLRRKLCEDRDHPRHLRTVWGIGYRWIP
jgi:DNA-binding response OmpR family regulator